MKRILLVSPFPPYIGGVSISVQRLYEYLTNSGFEVVKFNTQMGNRKYNIRILKFIRYLMLPVFLIGKKRFDIIHFHVSDIMPKFYVSLWRRFFPGSTRFILTIHGQLKHTLRSRIGYYSLKGFDRIICVKKGDMRHMPPELKQRTVEIPAFIPPVVTSEKAGQIPSDLRKFLEYDSFKILLNGFIICNDKYHDLYGFRDAILLLSKLRQKGRNARLILIVLGNNYDSVARSYLAELKKYSAENDLDKYIFWIEGATMELWPVLKRVNVLLRPTKSDGDALSVRESLFLKIPVITSNAVPRPAGTVVYKLKSGDDLLYKTLQLMDHYEDFVSCIGQANTNFAHKILEQYEE